MLARKNSSNEKDLASHYDPEGLFQQGILAKCKKDMVAILEGIEVEHQKRMQELEQEYAARQRFWDSKERQLNFQFQVCDNKWP